MSEQSGNDKEKYSIEKNLAKKVKKGRVYYLVKWKALQTWELATELSCANLISLYEDGRKKEKDCAFESGSEVCKRNSPIWTDTGNVCKEKKRKEHQLTGFKRNLQPEAILGATNMGGQLMFLMKWADSTERDWVTAKEAHLHCPQTVIHCYENKLQWTE